MPCSLRQAGLDVGPRTAMSWVRGCAVGDVADGEAIEVDSVPPVALFNVGGEWLATSIFCTHDKSSLAEGYIDGDVVECAWHFAKFCLRTGAALSLPATTGVKTFETKVDDGVVYIHLETPENSNA
jgi:nitrite reductase/ring-hydroxylating ferredoxin subunit